MIALAMAISSEVCNILIFCIALVHLSIRITGCSQKQPQTSKTCLGGPILLLFFLVIIKCFKRIWLNRMDEQKFQDVSSQIQTLHRSMKNVIEIVSATSPLLALSTHGWALKSFHSNYLLRVCF